MEQRVKTEPDSEDEDPILADARRRVEQGQVPYFYYPMNGLMWYFYAYAFHHGSKTVH